MSKHIGIVCEGPTDYILLKGIVDHITETDNQYVPLQPEEDLSGKYGNGWKGVWKWCTDHGEILDEYRTDVSPRLDLIIIQMDGDVARKEKEIHCTCEKTLCQWKGLCHPLECSYLKNEACPVRIPCAAHAATVEGYIDHLTKQIILWLKQKEGICVVIPCDSTDAWVAAAYETLEEPERIEDPWKHVISKGKSFHGIRIPGHKKSGIVYRQFVQHVCSNWENVRKCCLSARIFEEHIRVLYDEN